MIGTNLGPYRLDAELGAGGMGTVYRATGPSGTVALKIVHPHLLETPGFFKRFLREAEIGKAVVHENVVRTLDADAFVADGGQRHVLVMEYVEGQTLRRLIEEMGRVPEALCRHVGREMAKGLAAIHAAGVVHRDVKPDNVIVTPQHAVKLMDLGVARLVDEAVRLSQTGAFVGSLDYAAPEQIVGDGDDLDARADLHALGLVLHEMATGAPPFGEGDWHETLRAVVHVVPRRLGEIDPQISPFFEELVATLLKKKREERFASAEEVARVLSEGEDGAWWKERAKSIRSTTKRPLRRIRIARETAVYGRESEFAALRALFDRASQGDGQIALVEGEAGVGKSRLVDEFVAGLVASGEDVNFLHGSWPPGGAATARGAFTTAFREHFGDEGSAAHLAETPALVAAFDALLRGESAPPGSHPLTKDAVQTCFVRATAALAAERPTIVLVEDLHFAPDEGRALFAALAQAVAGMRVLLVGTTRPGLDEKWLAAMERIGATRIALPRLSPKALARLLADAFRSERLAEELSFKIATKSDGNPFFVFEILRGLRDGGLLKRDEDGSWSTTGAIDDIRVPSSVLELVQTRVAGLSEEDRALLDVASVVGFEFDPLLVGDVLGMSQIPLMRRLAHLEKTRRLVHAVGRRHVFDHHQVQEALYGGMPLLLREPYHAAVADALEARNGGPSAPSAALRGGVCAELASHFLKGGRGADALRRLPEALEHLGQVGRSEAAAALAGDALAAPGLLVGAARCDLLLRRATTLDYLGRRAEEQAALDEALALADASGDPKRRARTRRQLGWLLMSSGRTDEARTRLEEARVFADAAGDDELDAEVAQATGHVLHTVGRYGEAQERYEQALASARRGGNRLREAATLGNLGFVHYALGRNDEARVLFERQLEMARAEGFDQMVVSAAGNLGAAWYALGRFDLAQEHFEAHAASARARGDRAGEAAATGNSGNVFLARGLFALARERYERYLVLAREIGRRANEINALTNLGDLEASLGLADAARARLEGALVLAREARHGAHEGTVLHVLARAADARGDDAVALRFADEAIEQRRSTGQRAHEAESLVLRGASLARLGRHEDARAAWTEALAAARETSSPPVLVLASAGLAAAPGGDAGPALAALAADESALEWLPAMEARFVLWRATGDAAHLAEARRRLAFLVENAPEDCRGSMVGGVRLHREIAEASESPG